MTIVLGGAVARCIVEIVISLSASGMSTLLVPLEILEPDPAAADPMYPVD